MESPLVSIIVPIYNAAMDMVPCLESIKHQRYQHLEVLLVNDGSSDASLEICRMYARLDPRVIIIDKENTGVSGTRNAAIERARGKYLQFVDSDDQLDPNATRLLVEIWSSATTAPSCRMARPRCTASCSRIPGWTRRSSPAA